MRKRNNITKEKKKRETVVKTLCSICYPPFSFFEKRLDPNLPKKMLLIRNTNTTAEFNQTMTLDSGAKFSSHLLQQVLLLA